MNDTYKFIFTIVLVVLLFVFATPFLGWRTQPQETKELLQSRGYTQIEVDGYSWFACSEDDWYATSFEATPPSGEGVVRGTVCKGIFKGKTIRMD